MTFSHDTLQNHMEQEQLETCLIWQDGNIQYCFEQQIGLLETVRPINSCTKSIISLLCCIAMDKGLFPAPEEYAERYFPALKQLVPSHYRKPTIEHLLTLSVGFEWQEFGGIQSFPSMKRSGNWIDYLFKQPIVDEPGTKMCYNSGISQMLTTLLTETTGMSVAQFAEQHLFHPLSIEDYNWQQDRQGIYTGGFGLYLTPQDMLKIGIMCCNNGVFNGKRIISEARLAQSTAPYLMAQSPAKAGYYGWHWWVDEVKTEAYCTPYYYARGYGGQLIFIVPEHKLVVVTTKNQKIKSELPLAWFKQLLLPSYIEKSNFG